MTKLLTPTVICTGMKLRFSDHWKPADLWVFNGSYIVNASGDGVPNNAFPLDWAKDKILEGFSHDDYFERRNVYIFHPRQVVLNPALEKYIGEQKL